MGIVGPAIRGLTDGRIMMKRISEWWRPLKRETTHQNISPFYELNNRLKLGDWRKLVPADEKIKVSRLLQSIVQEYQIESQISNDLVFTYNDYQISPRAKKIEKKVKYIKRSSKCLVTDRLIHFPSNTNSGDRLDTRNLSVLDLTLCVLLPKNRMVQRDVNCGSSFMISTVDEIGKSIRNAYSFLPQHHPIHLFMDNAGGHGKKEIKEKYHVEKLKRDYNVIVVWQIPHSPETNMLDLGVWMGLQSEVEKYHRKRVMHRDVLARSVEVLFCDWIDTPVLNKVHERWKLVLQLIDKGKGTNDLVEKHHGLKRKLFDDLPELPTSDNEEVVENMLVDEEPVDDYEELLLAQGNGNMGVSV